MTVQPLATTAAQQAAYPSIWTGGKTTTSAGSDELGKDAFLKLLVAQLKYQDPMNPLQGADFIAQTAQFTLVEKIEEMAQQNAQGLVTQRIAQASALVGRAVSYTDSDGTSHTGTVASVKVLASGPVLVVGTDEVALTSVTEITTPPATTTTATTSGSTPAAG